MEFICGIFNIRVLFNTTFNYKSSQLGNHHIAGEENEAWSDPGNWTHFCLTPSPPDAMPAASTWVCACTGSSSSSSLLTLIVWQLFTRPAQPGTSGGEEGQRRKEAFPEHLWVPDTVLSPENTEMQRCGFLLFGGSPSRRRKKWITQLVIKAILWSQTALKSTECPLCAWPCAEHNHSECPRDSDGRGIFQVQNFYKQYPWVLWRPAPIHSAEVLPARCPK